MKRHPVKSGAWSRNGFSVIELMVVLSVAGILLAVGVPSLRSLIQGQRLTTTVNDLFAAVNLTRSEAIKRGARVDLAPVDGTDWAAGWVVFVDGNSNQKPDPGEPIIYAHGPVPGEIKIKANFTDALPFLAYNGTGGSRTKDGGPKSGHFLISLDDQARKVVINFLGRPRTCNPVAESSTC